MLAARIQYVYRIYPVFLERIYADWVTFKCYMQQTNLQQIEAVFRGILNVLHIGFFTESVLKFFC